MFQITFILSGKLHAVTTPDLYAAIAMRVKLPSARLWALPRNEQIALIR